MNKKSTKRALLTSFVSLMICCTMLIGTTFAWFTDTVTSSSNKIQSGNLKLDLELLENGTWTSIKDSKEPLFDNDLWEPGYTEYKLLKIENEGTLALDWVATFVSQKELSILADVIDVYVLNYGQTDEMNVTAPTRELTGYTKVGTLRDFINSIEDTTYGSLEAKKAAYLGIALKMQESAGNEYQGLDLGGEFDITILASQASFEKDSFDANYDENSETDTVYVNSIKFEEGDSAVNVEVRGNDKDKIASVLVPAAAIAEGDDEVKVVVTPAVADGNIAVDAEQETKVFDVKVLGIKKDNTEMITVELRIPAGLDPATVKLYHYDKEIACSYNPSTGYVTFQTTSFSPFTVVYDAKSKYEVPSIEGVPLPVAIVEEYELPEKIEWGKYGQWSPTENLEANLETAYKLKCPQTAAEVAKSPYANWYCDFYVSLDQNLGENELFLGGNYGSFGWIGFHNGDITPTAKTEIGLLEGVTTNPWTYLDVANYVGTFICGVGDVNDALSGATFTVKLRLTNPENADEYYNVNTINYTFE